MSAGHNVCVEKVGCALGEAAHTRSLEQPIHPLLSPLSSQKLDKLYLDVGNHVLQVANSECAIHIGWVGVKG